jgi:hypothetical protein
VRRLGAAKVLVAVDPFFPLESLYLEVVTPKAGVPVATMPVAEACPQGRVAVDAVSRRGCESVLLVADAAHCDVAPDPDVHVVRGYLFQAVCDKPGIERTVTELNVDGAATSG